jgi:hypothetical protein
MRRTHPLVNGLEAIAEQHRALPQRYGIFDQLYEQVHANWTQHRESDRWPTANKNWALRVAPTFTHDTKQRLEKQLQKQIATCFKGEGWGNDIVTASGLINARGRQMNIDLAHQITDGFEFIELKLKSNTPYDAALQILRYGAVYMLYRLEPELASRLKFREMIDAKRIVLEVLAPLEYYSPCDLDLRTLQTQLNREVKTFAKHSETDVDLSFRFMAFPSDFSYEPGMNCKSIRDAVSRRLSPFTNPD